MKTRPAILAAALSAAMLSASALPAAAADTPNGRVGVTYSDLDLSTEAGRSELAKRFDKAARDLCKVRGEEPRGGRERYCYDNASKTMKIRVASILSEHDANGG